jgi:uncharacterized membrane protein YbhN (UPF0104 family)
MAGDVPLVEGRLHTRRILVVALLIVVIAAAANLLGWEIGKWFTELWKTMTSLSLATLLGGIVLVTVQTTLTGFAWYSILRYGYPEAGVRFRQILACYAAAVALNCVLPANLGTFAMLLMFSTIIAGAAFAGVLGAMAVQKIFYTLIGAFCYLYLFLTVSGSFDIQLKLIHEHPWAFVVLLAGIGVLLYLVAQTLKDRVKEWWEQAKEGGQILAHPRAFLGLVVLPETVSWVAMLGIIAVFLSAYDIPVDFHTLMRVVAGNSIANVTSVTPGGAGVTQAFNVVSLNGITSAKNATAYSITQQLVVTSWSILYAIILLVWAFGWSGGKTLVSHSYLEAREKSAEQAAARKAKREAKRKARRSARSGASPGSGQLS